MAFGKLYTREVSARKLQQKRRNTQPLFCCFADGLFLQNNPRSIAIRAVAKANKLDLEEVPTDPPNVSTEYVKLNKLGQIPSFVGADGYELTESIAIAIYSMLLHLSFSRKLCALK